jgi:hypothetical protein
MQQNGTSPMISCFVKLLPYSLLGYSEIHGDEWFRARLKAHFPALQILNPTDVLQQPGQCSQYSVQTIGWTIRVSNPDRRKKLMLLENDHFGSASYLMSSGSSFSKEKVAEE